MKKVFLAVCVAVSLVNCSDTEDNSVPQINPLIGSWNLENTSVFFRDPFLVTYDTTTSLIPMVIDADGIYNYNDKQELTYSTSYRIKVEAPTTGAIDYGKDGSYEYNYKIDNGRLILLSICDESIPDCRSTAVYVPCDFKRVISGAN